MDGPLVAISDWPDFAMRAVLLDLNPYGRVPKMDTLLGIIDVLSLLKINQFHTFFRVGSTDASYLCYCKRWDYIYLSSNFVFTRTKVSLQYFYEINLGQGN